MKTMSVTLIEKTLIGENPMGEPVYEEHPVSIKGCLVGQPTSDDIAETLSLYGKHIAYVIGVPKGDTHKWYDTDVILWGERYHTIGYPQRGIEANVPLNWGQNVRVERFG